MKILGIFVGAVGMEMACIFITPSAAIPTDLKGAFLLAFAALGGILGGVMTR